QPDPADCVPCKARLEEMQSGLIALLDHLVQEETGPEGDIDIIHHARKLHTLLSARANKPSKARQELDKKRPETEKHVLVPTYIAKKISQAASLPPLPPITELHLQEAVFIHRSFDKGLRAANAKDWNYEKLEFLGDAYLEVISSRLIYSRFPHLEPGPQSQLRESLVKNETLQQFAEGYGLGDRIRHTGHIDKDKKAWLKISADVFEAYVAAIVLSDPEHGFETAEKWLTELWAPQLLAHREKVIQDPAAFDTLQKKLGAKNVKLDYRQERPMEMRGGVQNFFLGVYLTGWGYEEEWLGSGEGQNKSLAKQAAAADAVKR
ncbi:double-strand-specific ribonuclease Pac1, partial [Lophiotrema nucula]